MALFEIAGIDHGFPLHETSLAPRAALPREEGAPCGLGRTAVASHALGRLTLSLPCCAPHLPASWANYRRAQPCQYSERVELALENQIWTVAGPLDADASGFGRVLEVLSPEGESAVAKLVPKRPGAERELLIGDSVAASKYLNVVPIVDTGEHGDSWVLVMPRADKSLAQYLKESGGALPLPEVLKILTEIATALTEIDGAIVHRDLKPANVLLHEGSWKLADFGISRYVDASTAEDTRKFSFTPPYAAPEQWEFRRATSASDVYSFGIIAYQLLDGSLPFAGPNKEDFRQQHLTEPSPALDSGPAKLRILIEECLYKSPDARPHPAAILARLDSVPTTSMTAGASRLAEANHRHVRERARQQALYTAEQDRQTQFQRTFDAASRSLEGVAALLEGAIRDNAPDAEFINITGNAAPRFKTKFRDGSLTFGQTQPIEHWHGPFEVLAASNVTVDFGRPGRNWVGRSHSLWFGDPLREGEFGWFELAFMESPLRSESRTVEPFACLPYETNTFDSVTGGQQLAWPLMSLEPADPAEFIDRWLGWLADAATGVLRQPSTMPERSIDRVWRRR